MKKALIDEKVTHQGIGGKEIKIEKEFTIGWILEQNLNEINIALQNFILRRIDLINEKHEDMKIYYGHVGNLGYFVADDEIKFEE